MLEADGIVAAQRYVTQGVDLIVLDIKTPGISGVDGIDVVGSWARDPVHLPIVVLTALDDTDIRVASPGPSTPSNCACASRAPPDAGTREAARRSADGYIFFLWTR